MQASFTSKLNKLKVKIKIRENGVLRLLAALVEGLSSVPSTHIWHHSHLPLSPAPGDSTLSSGPEQHQDGNVHTHTDRHIHF